MGEIGLVAVEKMAELLLAKRDWHEESVVILAAEYAGAAAQMLRGLFVAKENAEIADGAIDAIRRMLVANDVPGAAFIDDHVGNAIVQRNEARAERVHGR